MSLNRMRGVALWILLAAFLAMTSGCQSTPEPSPSPSLTPLGAESEHSARPGEQEPAATGQQILLYIQDDPPLGFRYDAGLQLEQGTDQDEGQNEGQVKGQGEQRISLSATMGSRLDVTVKSLTRPIDLRALAEALVSVDQDQLAAEQDASNFSAFTQVSLAGEPALRYGFVHNGRPGTRFLLPVEERMYAATMVAAHDEESRMLEAVLDSMRVRDVSAGLFSGPEPSPDLGPDSALASSPALPPGSSIAALSSDSVTADDVRRMLWSFCPFQLIQAGEVIAQRRDRDGADMVWQALDVERKALRQIIFQQQGRALPELEGAELLDQARAAASHQNGAEAVAQAQRTLGLALLVNQDMSAARQALDAALRAEDQQAFALLATALWHGPVQSEVEPLLIQAEELDFRIPASWLIRAWLAQVRGDTEQARRNFRRALEVDAQNIAALTGLGRLEMDDARTRALAAERFLQVLSVHGADDVALYNLALIRMRQDQTEQALRYVQTLLERYPNDAWAWNLQGRILRKQGKPELGAKAYRRAIQADPEHVQAHFNLGVLCAQDLDDVYCARDAFSTFLRLRPDGPRARQAREWLDLH
jgi:tetratricopeptide (TPR) repeat protein